MIEGSRTGNGGRTLRYGMVGGGTGAFIGDVHRRAIALEGGAFPAAGCFSRDFENTRATGRNLGIAEDRLYESYAEMARREAAREDRIDFVVIVTPNDSHHAIAKAFLQAEIPVVCDKPLAVSSQQAEELARIAQEGSLPFCVTYTYTGYPAVKQAREMVRGGELGRIRFVQAEYPQEWLCRPMERAGNRQAEWRTDPQRSGNAGALGDIGSHIENLVSYVTGLEIESLCARTDTFVEGRQLDDNATVMVDYRGGAKGLYWCSQIAVGFDNALKIRVIGENGSLTWEQENPNYLRAASLDGPVRILSRGRDAFHPAAAAFSRVPAGHPEGYFEAFAGIYRAFLGALRSRLDGRAPSPEEADFPTAEDGLRGVRFIEKCLESAAGGSVRIHW